MDLKRFNQKPLMGIVRGLQPEHLAPLVDTVIEAGLETLEVAMNTSRAADLIHQAVQMAGDRLMIGAGTVLSTTALNEALQAGASYIVSPINEADVVAYCVENNIPVFPGALTPQEVYYAWLGGATMVKVFPAGCFGPAYFKELKGPFKKVKLLACGGVNASTIGQYLKNGADAMAFGGSIFKSTWLEEGRFDLIGQEIKQLIEALRAGQLQ